MEKKNVSLMTEFVLTGLTDHQGLQVPLFLVFLVIYLITIVGNLGLIVLIWNDPHLHTPMYLFLGSLAFVDAWVTSTVTPNMLVNLIAKSKLMSLSECMIQFFCFCIWWNYRTLSFRNNGLWSLYCHMQTFTLIMSNRVCIRLLVLSFVGGFLHSLIHKGVLLRLTFCNSNIIHHFYCDIIPLFKISCTDPSINFLMVFILSGSIQVFTIVVVLVSYTLVVFTILKKNSLKGLRKAFSTCGAHLLSASLYYSPLLFMYVLPASQQTDGQGMMDSLFYMVLIPVLNPIIYSLRNKQVIDSLTKVLKRNI